MEKMLVLKAVSERKQREITKQDGSKKMLPWYDVILTNGVDTIMGETSEALTAQIDNTDENYRLKLEVGTVYMCRFTLSVIPYEKNGQKSHFNKVTFHQMCVF